MGNFTRTKLTLLLQDIYSTVYVSNLAEDIIRDTDKKGKNRKHKMVISHKYRDIKNDLIYILLEKDPKKQDKLFRQIYEDIRNYQEITFK